MNRALPRYTLWYLVLIWAVLTGGLFYLAEVKSQENHEFETASAGTEGRITEKYERISRGSHGSTNYIPCLSYTYSVGKFSFTIIGVQVSRDTWSMVNSGDGIPIRYLTSNVSDNRIDLPPEQDRARIAASGPLVIGIMFFAFGGGILGYWWGENLRWHHLVKSGERSVGVVTSTQTQTTGYGKSRRKIRYIMVQFTDGNGQKIKGRSWDIGYWQLRRWRVGDPITIYYNRSNSKTFTFDLAEKKGIRTI